MKNTMKTIALIALCVICGGCETYQRIPLMPDNLNYTHYFNNDFSPGSDAIGCSWNLSRKSPYNVNSLK